MLDLLPILIGILQRGCIGAFVVMAVYLTSRIMKFDDFSIEGIFGLGGAVVAWCVLHHINPWVALLLGSLSGGLCGCLTALLHTKLELNKLVSGIVVTTMLFSISINIASANLALGDASTIFTPFQQKPWPTLVLVASLYLATALLFIYFMKTEVGFLLRSTGINPQFTITLAKSVPFYITLTLVLANALSAFSGGLFVQFSGFYSVFGNVGILVSALAGCMIAELFKYNMFLMSLLGSIIYQFLIAMAIELEIEPSWQKLITGLMIIAILLLKKLEKNKVILP